MCAHVDLDDRNPGHQVGSRVVGPVVVEDQPKTLLGEALALGRHGNRGLDLWSQLEKHFFRVQDIEDTGDEERTVHVEERSRAAGRRLEAGPK